MTLLLALLGACSWGGSPPQTALPEPLRLDVSGPVRLVLLGDTGTVGPEADTPACEGRTDGKIVIDPAGRARMIAAVRAEQAHAVIALGDLVYPSGPECSSDRIPDAARKHMDAVMGDYLGQLDALSLLVLGNHDVDHSGRGNARTEACFRQYAAEKPTLYLPERNYTARIGKVRVGVIDTNRLPDRALSASMKNELAEGDAWWTLLAGHHVLRTFHNKEDQDVVRPWLSEHGIAPDLYVNGHAHLLQHGVYDAGGAPVPAATSGTGAKVRCRPECGAGAAGACGEGQTWGRSAFGYAVVDATEALLTVTYKDASGNSLYCWQRDKGTPSGRDCPTEDAQENP